MASGLEHRRHLPATLDRTERGAEVSMTEANEKNEAARQTRSERDRLDLIRAAAWSAMNSGCTPREVRQAASSGIADHRTNKAPVDPVGRLSDGETWDSLDAKMLPNAIEAVDAGVRAFLNGHPQGVRPNEVHLASEALTWAVTVALQEAGIGTWDQASLISVPKVAS